MFPSLSVRRRASARNRSGGFTLIEVIVALGIFVFATAAIYSQIVVGLRATGTARDVTQAKGVAQAKLEQMRSMPFYVGREAGDYIDILDTYYRNTMAPAATPSCGANTLPALPTTNWTGYVSAPATHCSWEPTGPLYRKVINPVQSPGLGAFAMVVSTQFLRGSTPPSPASPLAGYDSQVAGRDQPASSQVGITVAVFYQTQSGVKFTSNYTQIERSSPMDPLIQSKAKVTALHVSSAARTWGLWNLGDIDPAESNNAQVNLMSDIGVVDLTGELFTGSRVIANATGAAGATSLPSVVTGAATHLRAPADVPLTGLTSGDTQLPNGCTWICYGATNTDQVFATASQGLPNSGTPDAPVRAMVQAGAGRYGVWFDNGRWLNRLNLLDNHPMVSLDTTLPGTMQGVRDCVVGGAGSTVNNAHLTSTGYLTATAADAPNREVRSCATAQINMVRVFPTSFAPDGVIRIRLDRASASCTVRRNGSNDATADYSATVRYWDGSAYTTAGTAQRGNATDPLSAVPLATPVGNGLTLGDFVSSWSSLTDADLTRTTNAKNAEVNIPGVVTLITQPTRTFDTGWGLKHEDPSSSISVTVGALSCAAGDYR